MSDRDRIQRDRAAIREKFGALYDDVTALLFRRDPMGINFETNTDEYEAEARTILPRLATCKSPADVTKVVHEEFVRWFSPADAGQPARYERIGAEIWELLRKHNG